ncbi:MAG: hypothetical protein ACKOQ8_06685, partial [Micrococcales bacterium]
MATPTPKPNPFLKGNSGASTGGTGSQNPFLKPAPTKPAGAAKKAPAANPWAPAISAGQAVLNALATPMYFVEGTIASGGNIAKGAENVGNAFAGKKTVSGHDLLVNAGMDPKFGNVNILGADINLPGLAADILLDPLTYVPGGAIVTASKSGLKAISTAGRAINDAAHAKVALKVVERSPERNMLRTGTPKAAPTTPATPLAPKNARATLFNEDSALGETARANQSKRIANVYYSVPVEKGRSVAQALNDIMASGLEGLVKGAKTGYYEGRLMQTVDKARKAENKLAKSGQSVAVKLLDSVGSPAVIAKDEAGFAKLTDGTSAELTPMTPIKHGKQWLVAPDETSRIYQFDTEGGARKWISDNGADSSVATREFKAKPIIDTAPSQFDSIVEAAAKTAPDPTAAKDIMKRVAEADSLAKETNGIRAGLSTHAAQINYLLNPERLQAKLEARLSLNGNKLISATNARLHIEDALNKNDVNAAVDYLRRNFPAAANEILSMSIKGDKGPVPIGKILSTNAISLNRLPAEEITRLRAAINNIIAPEAANAVREGLRNDLNRLLGSEEDSSKLVAAVFGKRDQKAIDEVLAAIQSPTTQVKYNGISDLISGLRSGHQVDPKQVMKIAKLLSPEAYDWSKVSKNLDNGDTVNGLIGTIIKNGGGAQTMATTMERLSLLDSGQLAAATGISAS